MELVNKTDPSIPIEFNRTNDAFGTHPGLLNKKHDIDPTSDHTQRCI